MKYGEYLKQLRIGRKIVLRQFARLIGVKMVELSGVERGTMEPFDKERTISLLKYLGHDEESKEAKELVRLIDEPWETKHESIEEILAKPTTFVTRSETIDEYCGTVEEEAVNLFTQRDIIEKVIRRLESIEEESKIARRILRKVSSQNIDVHLTVEEQQYLSWPGYIVREK